MNQFQLVHVNQVHLDRMALRHSVTPESVQKLAESIASEGLMQPIVVRARDGGGWSLIAGRRRLEAHKVLGYTQIQAHIIDAPTLDEVPAINENLMRLQMNPVEEAEAVNYLHAVKKMSLNAIAAATHHSNSWVQDRLSILGLPDTFKAAIAKRKVSIGAALQLMLITDEPLRDQYLEYAKVNGATVQQCEAWYSIWKGQQDLMLKPDPNAPSAQPLPEPPVMKHPCYNCRETKPSHEVLWVPICLPCNQEVQRLAAELIEENANSRQEGEQQTEPSKATPGTQEEAHDEHQTASTHPKN